jgi:hypothetical protein
MLSTEKTSSESIPATRKRPTKNEIFLRICNERNFVGFTFVEMRTKIENGEKKKDAVGYPPSWSKITKENYLSSINPAHKGFAFRTGNPSGITVIDCDTVTSYEGIIRDFPELKECLTVKTNKGFHIYCKYTPQPKNNEESFHSYPDIDIRNDGGIIFAPPTTYNFFGTKTGYKFVNKKAPLLELPKKLLSDLKDKSKTTRVIDLKDKSGATRIIRVKSEEPKNESIKFAEQIDLEVRADELRQLICSLPEDYLKDGDTWRKVGAIVHHELGDNQFAKQLFLEISKRSPTHRDKVKMSDVEKVWRFFSSNKEKIVTIASIYHNARAHGILQQALEEGPQQEHQQGPQQEPQGPQQEPQEGPQEEPQLEHQEPQQEPQKEPKDVFDFEKDDINHTTLARYFVICYGADFVQTKSIDGKSTALFHWSDIGKVWEPNIQAKQHMLRMIGDEFFFKLQSQAASLKGGQRLSVFTQLPRQLQCRTNKEKIQAEIITQMPISEVDFDTNAAQYDNLQFRNGVLMLNKVVLAADNTIKCDGAFRPRIKEDKITQFLDWDFGPAEEENLAFVKEIFRQIQPEAEQLQFQLDWLAYCLTGHTGAQRFKMNIGHTALNGKSTEANIHRNVFGMYSTKIPKNTFAEDNQKAHKPLMELLQSPIRLAYMEELDRKKIDIDAFKEWVDGKEQTVEVMYGYQLRRRIQAKFMSSSNKDPNADADAGFIRRGLIQYYYSKFVLEGENPAQNIFKKIENLDETFLQERFRRAYLTMLLPHVFRYYSGRRLAIPAFAERQFEKIMDEYDAFKTALYEICEKGTQADCVWKDDVVSALKLKMGQHIKWEKHVLPEIKRFGLIYERDSRVLSKYSNRSERGIIRGLKWPAILDEA